MRKFVVFTVLFSLGLCATVGAAETAPVLSFSPAGWTVVLAGDAIPSEKYAAQEFQAIIEQASGVKLPIAAAAPKPTHNIFIGVSKDMQGSSVGFSIDAMGEEELRLRVGQDNIAIAGGRPRGTLYGVYEFLERYMGVRFLTVDHTHVPQFGGAPTIPCEDFAFEPIFSFRWSYYGETISQPAFAARLRGNTVTGAEHLGGATPQSLISHSYGHQLPLAKYAKEHPEYFAFVKGRRRTDAADHPQPCCSNPEVIDIITQRVLADLRANPSRRNISVSMRDNRAYCGCEKCVAIDTREGGTAGAHFELVNAVAAAVEKEFPETKVGTLAYRQTRKPPKRMELRDNIQIQLCSIECSVLTPLDDPTCEANRRFYKELKKWAELCDDIWIWNYNTNFHFYTLPFPNLRVIGPNMRFFAENNVKGVFMQANGNGMSGEMSDLRNYVMSRTLWNPSLDSWELVEEFCRLHYKESAEVILEYLVYIHDVAEACGEDPDCFGEPHEYGITPAVAQKALDYFDRALALAKDDAVRARVEKASICAYSAAIETSDGAKTWADGYLHYDMGAEGKKHLPRYAELGTKYGVRMQHENQSFASYITAAKEWAAKAPAPRLENDTWRLTFLPDDNGKLVEAVYKPTGRDLVLPWEFHSFGAFRGSVKELGIEGLPRSVGACEAEIEGNTMRLTSALADGTLVARTITLEGGKIRFNSSITHGADAPKAYQVKVHPEWNVGTTSESHLVLSGYIKDGDTWTRFNQKWQKDYGPDIRLLESATGGGVAFFNHRERFGLLQTYDPDIMETPRFWWDPENQHLNLELLTKETTLAKGETFTYAYDCEYLTRRP